MQADDDWRQRAGHLTPFQRAVLEVCASLPTGCVTTYGAIAHALGGSAQAVGNALAKNPFAPTVPCHRIVKAGPKPSLGGFCGHAQGSQHDDIGRKQRLLATEGVRFDASLRLLTSSALLSAGQLDRSAVNAARALIGKPPLLHDDDAKRGARK